MEEVINGILIREVETKNIMTKSSLPVGGYSVNPYVGCTHACKYCYASFMKRFTGHKEEWGTFLDVKHWPEIKNPKKYAGQRVVIGSVTDGYNPQEEQFGNTRKLLEQLIGSDADILICTKSDLVVRDIDLLKKLGRVTVSWSINTLDENFKNDMDSASSIEHRIAAMKQVYEAGIRTVCFVSPVFPGITDFEAIFERVKNQCDLFWLENLNLRGGFKKTIMDYIAGKYPDLVRGRHSPTDRCRAHGYWNLRCTEYVFSLFNSPFSISVCNYPGSPDPFPAPAHRTPDLRFH